MLADLLSHDIDVLGAESVLAKLGRIALGEGGCLLEVVYPLSPVRVFTALKHFWELLELMGERCDLYRLTLKRFYLREDDLVVFSQFFLGGFLGWGFRPFGFWVH